MRYFKIEYGTPYCGTEETEYLKFPDDYTNEEVYDYEIERTEIPEHCIWRDT